MPNEVWRTWRIVAKVDPDKPLQREQVKSIRSSGLDAVIVGGTQGITRTKVASTLSALADTGLPLAVEVSTEEALLPGPDLFLVPVVLNTLDVTWVTGAHQAVAYALRGHLDWTRAATEGYIVLNPDSAAARLTSARAPLSPEEAVAYAEVGVRVLGLPMIYLEYSGVFGSPDVVKACGRVVAGTGARLVYGGGIVTPAQARLMAPLADTLVVGNLVQSPDHARLPAIVAAVRASQPH